MAERITRRSLLVGGAAVGGVLVVDSALRPAAAREAVPHGVQTVTLALARVGAVFPAPFPSFGERGTALSRATASRLDTRYAEVKRARRERVAAGCRIIGVDADSVSSSALLRRIGTTYANVNASDRLRIEAVVSLAIATVSKRFAVDDDQAAQLWLVGLAGAPAGGGRRLPIRVAR